MEPTDSHNQPELHIAPAIPQTFSTTPTPTQPPQSGTESHGKAKRPKILDQVRSVRHVLDSTELIFVGTVISHKTGNSLCVSINRDINKHFRLQKGDIFSEFIHPDGYIILVPRYTPGLPRDVEVKIPKTSEKPYAPLSDVMIVPQDDLGATKTPENPIAVKTTPAPKPRVVVLK